MYKSFTVLFVLMSAMCAALQPNGAQADTVYLDMDVELDQVAPEDEKMYRVGGHDLDRIGYDDKAVDPVTHKTRITYLAHFIMGRWMPTEPTEASTLDLSSKPYKLDFVASVSHGQPLVVVFESASQRMAILSRPDFHMLIAGKYSISPAPLKGAEATKPPAKANDPSTMPMKSGMPPMPPKTSKMTAPNSASESRATPADFAGYTRGEGTPGM